MKDNGNSFMSIRAHLPLYSMGMGDRYRCDIFCRLHRNNWIAIMQGYICTLSGPVLEMMQRGGAIADT
ncbi:hypothetical protein VTN96DRAFT_8213 [Rasamsonia emersonii]